MANYDFDFDVERYLDLIPMQYGNKPKFIEYNRTFLDLLADVRTCLDTFWTKFNLDKAEGDQLDKIGELVGISRVLPLVDADIPSVLDDELYRLVIRSKAAQNHWDGTLQGWNDILTILFPDSAFDIVDNFDMTVTVNLIDPSFDATRIALLVRGYLLPKPAAVKVNYNVVDQPIFGWDTETPFIKGWDESKWSG